MSTDSGDDRASSDAEAPSHTSVRGGERNGARTTILYIEDDESNVDLVKRILRGSKDLRLLTAPTAREALEKASDDQCDLILTDLNLPDLSGDVLLGTLRQHPATRHLPLVVVSGENSQGLDERVRAAGALSFLHKPYTAGDLTMTLRRALRGELRPAAAGPADQERPQAEPLFDQLRRIDPCDGDRMVARFMAASPTEMAAVRAALEVGDAKQVHYLAHRLKGSLALFGAATAAERLEELSQLAAAATMDGADPLLAAAEEALDRYLDELGRPTQGAVGST